MPEPHLRASDSDRSAVAVALGEHMAAGRLTLAEYEERLTHVYQTKTLGGLASLTADLPTATAPTTAKPAPTEARAPRRDLAWHGWCGNSHAWDAWRRTAIIVLAIWAVTSLANWEFIYFWPIWVIGPWGAVLLAQSFAGGDRDRDERQRLRA